VVGFRRTFRVSLPPLITVFLHPVLLLSEWSFICGTILCSLFVPSGVFRRDDFPYARSDAESASLLCFRTSLVDIFSLIPRVGCIIRLFVCRVMVWVRDGLITIRLLLSFAFVH
jgi:hypothetical protein